MALNTMKCNHRTLNG